MTFRIATFNLENLDDSPAAQPPLAGRIRVMRPQLPRHRTGIASQKLTADTWKTTSACAEGEFISAMMRLGHGEQIDPILVSRSLRHFFRHAEIGNEALPDESGTWRTDTRYPESDHAPAVAEFV